MENRKYAVKYDHIYNMWSCVKQELFEEKPHSIITLSQLSPQFRTQEIQCAISMYVYYISFQLEIKKINEHLNSNQASFLSVGAICCKYLSKQSLIIFKIRAASCIHQMLRLSLKVHNRCNNNTFFIQCRYMISIGI